MKRRRNSENSESTARMQQGDRVVNLEGLSIRDHNTNQQDVEGLQQNQQEIAKQLDENPESAAELLPPVVQALYAPSAQLQLDATINLRKMLTIECTPPIQEVINAGVVPRLVEYLKLDAPTDQALVLQKEAACALAHIASSTSEHTTWLVGQEVIPLFVKLLSSPSFEVQEQALWAIGNIAGDSPRMRDAVIAHNAIPGVIAFCSLGQPSDALRNATWTLANLCRGKPPIPLETARTMMPTLVQLAHAADEEVLVDACWALSCICDGDSDRIAAIIDAGALPRAVELLGSSNLSVQTPALRVVRSVASGDDAQRQCLLDCGVLTAMQNLLSSPKRSTQKEASATMSTIAAGPLHHVQAVAHANVFPALIDLANQAEFQIKKEALAAIAKALSVQDAAVTRHLVQLGCLEPMCDGLSLPDPKSQTVAIMGIESVLRVGDRLKAEQDTANPFYSALNKLGAPEALTELASVSVDAEVRAGAQRVLQVAALAA